MKKPKPVVRLYRGADAEIQEHMRVIYTLFRERLADFTAFDTTMDAAYADVWLAELKAAEGVVQNSAVVGRIMQETELVGAALQAVRDACNDVEFFAKKAFRATSPGTLRSFGFKEIRAAGSQQAELDQALRVMYNIAKEHADTLIAKGFTQGGIDAVEGARVALESADSAQETLINGRMKATEERVHTLNAPYIRMVDVNAAARLIYRTDAVVRKMFQDKKRKPKKGE